MMQEKSAAVIIEKLIFGSQALSHLEDGRVVFVSGDILPGEKAKLDIIQKKKDFAKAKLAERLSSSALRVAPPCPYFGRCGGCYLQNLNYENQLKIKEEILKESLTNIGKMSGLNVSSIIGSPVIWRYRHKLELTCGQADNGEPILGFYEYGSWLKLVDLSDCLLFDQRIADLILTFKQWMRKYQLRPFDHRHFKGQIRGIVFKRTSKDQWLIGLLLTEESLDKNFILNLAQEIKKKIPLSSFYTQVTKIRRQKGETCRDELVFGQEYIEEEFLGLKFNLRFNSFFQNNLAQAQNMVQFVLNNINPQEAGSILDLYCGLGTFTLPLTKFLGNEVTGVELVAEAIAAAKENAKLNNLNKAEFIAADAKSVTEEILKQNKFAVVVVDPPRAGLDARVISSLLSSTVRKIFYVSCNPATLARDLGALNLNYEIKKIQPFDMFPQTYHIECVAVLERK